MFCTRFVANPVDVMISFPAGKDLYSPETLDVVSAVHKVVETQAAFRNRQRQ